MIPGKAVKYISTNVVALPESHPELWIACQSHMGHRTTYFHSFPEVIGEILSLSDSVTRNVSYHWIAYLLEVCYILRIGELNFILSHLLQRGFDGVFKGSFAGMFLSLLIIKSLRNSALRIGMLKYENYFLFPWQNPLMSVTMLCGSAILLPPSTIFYYICTHRRAGHHLHCRHPRALKARM